MPSHDLCMTRPPVHLPHARVCYGISELSVSGLFQATLSDFGYFHPQPFIRFSVPAVPLVIQNNSPPRITPPVRQWISVTYRPKAKSKRTSAAPIERPSNKPIVRRHKGINAMYFAPQLLKSLPRNNVPIALKHRSNQMLVPHPPQSVRVLGVISA